MMSFSSRQFSTKGSDYQAVLAARRFCFEVCLQGLEWFRVQGSALNPKP